MSTIRRNVKMTVFALTPLFNYFDSSAIFTLKKRGIRIVIKPKNVMKVNLYIFFVFENLEQKLLSLSIYYNVYFPRII